MINIHVVIRHQVQCLVVVMVVVVEQHALAPFPSVFWFLHRWCLPTHLPSPWMHDSPRSSPSLYVPPPILLTVSKFAAPISGHVARMPDKTQTMLDDSARKLPLTTPEGVVAVGVRPAEHVEVLLP